ALNLTPMGGLALPRRVGLGSMFAPASREMASESPDAHCCHNYGHKNVLEGVSNTTMAFWIEAYRKCAEPIPQRVF
ncbi:MAG: hypothetical protein ACKVJU_22510, partial [Verrucomicrobiales bacterium]